MVKRVRDDWISAARATLVREGLDAVSVQSLSRKLGVTRGGFYGYFGSREGLLEQLLEDWRETNTRELRRIAAPSRKDGTQQFTELVRMWIENEGYDPAYDTAIREWARRSRRVGHTVRRIDSERIRLLTRIFKNLGFRNPEALIRARVAYYHQVGYYALAVHESRRARRRLSPLYSFVLTGIVDGVKSIPRVG